jgi:hypothetical protein
MGDWQPMASAPKDGLPILVHGEGKYNVVHFGVGILGAGWFDTERRYLRFTPHRWQYLPDVDEADE